MGQSESIETDSKRILALLERVKAMGYEEYERGPTPWLRKFAKMIEDLENEVIAADPPRAPRADPWTTTITYMNPVAPPYVAQPWTPPYRAPGQQAQQPTHVPTTQTMWGEGGAGPA